MVRPAAFYLFYFLLSLAAKKAERKKLSARLMLGKFLMLAR